MLDRIEANGPAFDGMKDYGAHLVVDALLDAMVNMDERRTVDSIRHPVARERSAKKLAPSSPRPGNCIVLLIRRARAALLDGPPRT